MTQQTIFAFEAGDTLLGRYRLEEVIGEGGMGTVWRALDLTLEHPVAIKVLPTMLARDKRAVARLKGEAKRNLELAHPHIVRLNTFEQDPARSDVAFLVMQYIKGRTLNDLLAEHPEGLPPDLVEPWAGQIASALDFAHSKGILHRDIKPANIIIEESSGQAYLMDFGIAREARDTMSRVTGQQDSSGTLFYMSPQQLMGQNHRSNDIYSFAATLFEVFSGDPPFVTGDIASQIREIMPRPLGILTEAMNQALLTGLEKVAESRPSSAVRFINMLFGPSDSGPGGDGNGESRDSAEHFRLGRMYELGVDVARDEVKAAFHYRKAASAGYAPAQFNLGAMLMTGRGAPRSDAEAVKWFREAAQQGDQEAQFNLARMYETGRGTSPDESEAVFWYRQAAERGLPDAQNNLGSMYEAGRGVPRDVAEAARWYREAAEQGTAAAEFNLGRMYETGSGVPRDSDQAARWYRKAAEQGVAAAQYNLGRMYETGRGVPKDAALAASWLQRASNGNQTKPGQSGGTL